MTTEALIGMGSEFWMDNNAGTPVLTKLGEITGIPLPNPQTGEIEATHFGSPNRRREYISGLIEDGEGDIALNYIPGSATDALLRGAQSSGATKGYKIVIPADMEGGTWEITGDLIVKGYERGVPMDDKMTATVSIRFTGASTEAAGV
jgi:predicted secreted protein